MIRRKGEKKVMKTNSLKLTKIVLTIALGFALCFAQESPERLAVYAYGSNDVGINKSIGNKLLATMVQSGVYMEIGDPASFQDELARSGKSDLASIIQVAKRYGTDYVCAVNITEVFGTHSISARLIKIASSQVVKTALVDHSLRSLEDLTAVSNELARQLVSHVAAVPTSPPVAIAPFPPVAEAVLAPPPPHPAMVLPPPVAFAAPQQDTVPQLPPPPPPQLELPPEQQPPPPLPPPPLSLAEILAPAPVAALAQKQCAKTYNINELLFKIKENFPIQLKDCSSKLAKDMLTPVSFGGKKLEPKSFMMQCPIDGIKKELPDGFPGVDKVIGSLTNFVQGIMNIAMAGGALDPKKLISAVSSMNVDGLLNEIKSLSNNECVVDEPYNVPAPSVSIAPQVVESGSSEGNNNGAVSFGIRAGINLSHTNAEYDDVYDENSRKYISGSGNYGDIFGMQFGFVLDFPASEMFHVQPGLMYIQKGMDDGKSVTAHYLELPLQISLKLSVFRLGVGPYIGLCVDGGGIFSDLDLGFSTGFGFDIGMFYIGAFYDYGFADMSDVRNFNFYNRTLGFNLGINL